MWTRDLRDDPSIDPKTLEPSTRSLCHPPGPSDLCAMLNYEFGRHAYCNPSWFTPLYLPTLHHSILDRTQIVTTRFWGIDLLMENSQFHIRYLLVNDSIRENRVIAMCIAGSNLNRDTEDINESSEPYILPKSYRGCCYSLIML